MIYWLAGLCLFGYFCGSLSFGYWLAKKRGVDIKKIGSGATGTTNVSRTLGKKFGALTFIIDLFKAWLPVFLATMIFPKSWKALLVAGIAIFGNIFPVWLKFKGGKGVASLLGTLLAINPKLFIFEILIWVSLFLIIKIPIKILNSSFSETMAVNNLLTIWFLPVIFKFIFGSLDGIIFSFIMVGVIYFSHRENIKRMKKQWNFKTESKKCSS